MFNPPKRCGKERKKNINKKTKDKKCIYSLRLNFNQPVLKFLNFFFFFFFFVICYNL